MTRVVANLVPGGHFAQAAQPFRASWIVAFLLAALANAGGARAAVTPSGATAAADAFYLELLRTGAEAYERKDFQSAVTDLRLACFGFLDQPSLLGEGLVRLGLAQAAGGDREGFLTTFGRLAEVERRFSAYSQGMAEDLRQAFGTVALSLVPPAQYSGLPGLPELAQRQVLAELVGLPPSKRRAELEKRAAAQPGDPRWQMLLAQVDLEQKKPAAAVKRMDFVLAKTPGDVDARCLRGRASAEAGQCDAALVDLRLCPRSGEDPALAGKRLACLVEAENWSEANAVLSGLSDAARKDAAIAKLAPKVAAGVAGGAAPKPGTAAVAAPAKPPAVAKVPPQATLRASAPAAAPTASSGTPAATPKPSSEAKPPAAATPPAKPSPGGEPAPVAATPPPATGSSKPVTPTPPPAVSTSGPTASPVSAPLPLAIKSVAPASPMSPLSDDELAELERARQMLRSARVATDVAAALSIARGIADAHPSDREAQLLTAEIAYRASLWRDAVTYFERADPGDKQPALLFYYAVALYESGNRPRAAAVLQRCLSKLQLTPVVQSYVERILGPGAASGARGGGTPGVPVTRLDRNGHFGQNAFVSASLRTPTWEGLR